MHNHIELVVLAATICLWAFSNIYLAWRFIKMANISFTVNITINPAASQKLSAVADPLVLTGQVGTSFSASLSSNVQGGVPPYKLTSAGTLPDGLSDDGSGNITGTPTTAGTSTLSVSVSDAS